MAHDKRWDVEQAAQRDEAPVAHAHVVGLLLGAKIDVDVEALFCKPEWRKIFKWKRKSSCLTWALRGERRLVSPLEVLDRNTILEEVAAALFCQRKLRSMSQTLPD